MVHYTNLAPTLGSIAYNLPKALYMGLFAPLPWQAKNAWQWLAALENIALLILITYSMFRLWKQRKALAHQLSAKAPLWWASLVYTLGLVVLMALAAPNFGTLVRYKVGWLMVLLPLLGLLQAWPKTGTANAPRARKTAGRKSTKN